MSPFKIEARKQGGRRQGIYPGTSCHCFHRLLNMVPIRLYRSLISLQSFSEIYFSSLLNSNHILVSSQEESASPSVKHQAQRHKIPGTHPNHDTSGWPFLASLLPCLLASLPPSYFL